MRRNEARIPTELIRLAAGYDMGRIACGLWWAEAATTGLV